MDPLTIGSIVGTAGPIIGGGLGYLLSEEDQREADRQALLAAQEYGNVSAPELQQLRSNYAGAPTDFGNKSARNAAIQALMHEGLSGGNSLEAQLANANAMRTAGQATRQAQQGALANAAQRGQGGGAAALQAQLLGGSMGADRAAQVGLEGAANARRQALEALQQGGSMAGGAEEADTSADLRRREGMDAMSRFNTTLAQQNFQNQVTTADRRSGAAGMRADVARGRGDRKRQVFGSAGKALGEGGMAYGLNGKG